MNTDRHAWSRPEPETVVPGVLRVPLPLPLDALRAVNVYVLESADDLTLVDGGWALDESRELLRTALRGIGADLGDIRRFLVTHMHRDHYTMATVLREAYGARVALGEGERESVDLVGVDEPMGAQVRNLRAAGAPELADEIAVAVAGGDGALAAQYSDPDEWLVDGQVLPAAGRTLTAVETPGHTRGHMVYVDGTDPARELLFAGDHVLPHITPSIGFEPGARPGALTRFLDSLARVRAMPDRMLLPAHGAVAPSVHARVDELLAHHDRRLDEIARTVERGASTGAEAAELLTWTRRETKLADLEPFHRMLAVLETDAHLEVLVAQGRLRRTADPEGVARHDAS